MSKKLRPVCCLALTLAMVLTLMPQRRVRAIGGNPVLSIFPTQGGDAATKAARFLEACLNMPNWGIALGQASYLGTEDGGLRNGASDSDLATCFGNMNARGLKLALGASVAAGGYSGSDAFAEVSGNIGHFTGLGASMGAVFMNEPLSVANVQDGVPYSTVVQWTVDFVQLMRNYDGSIKLVLNEQYPTSNTASAIITFMNDVAAECAARSVQCVDVFSVDHDMNAGGSVYDVGQMESAAHNLGWDFGVEFFPSGGHTDCDFGDIAVSRAAEYIEGGVYPDLWNLNSWDLFPASIAPSLFSWCSFMGGVDRVVLEDYFYPHGNMSISLQASNGQYVTAEGAGGGAVNANRDNIGSWETFDLIDGNGGDLEDGDHIWVRAANGYNFFHSLGSGNNYGAIDAIENRMNVDGVVLIVHRVSGSGPIGNGDAVSFMVESTSRYLSAENGGGQEVVGNRTAVGAWETFTLIVH